MKDIFEKDLGFKKNKVKRLARNREDASALLRKALKKIQDNYQQLGGISSNLQDLIRMLRAWLFGEYSEVPWKTIISSFAALLYLVNPLDAIPDFIAAIGLLDDITVLSFMLSQISSDLERFKSWEAEKSAEAVRGTTQD